MKRVSSVSLLLALAVGLSACHGSTWDCGPKESIVEVIQPEPAPEPAPEPEPEPACVAEPIQVGFEFNKAQLDSKGMSDMDSLVECIVGTDQHIQINGHADARGSDKVNDKLSLERANVVKDYMTARGLPEGQISDLKAWGKRQPIAHGNTEADHEQNRRAIVTVHQE